jgi:hypothetical protein
VLIFNFLIFNFVKISYLQILFFTCTALLTNAQNVGIGTATPSEKLHVAGSGNGLRIDGLSSTGTFTGNGTPLKAVFVDANGSLVKGGAGTPSIDAWYTVGNSGTTAGANFIGTTDAQALVMKTGGSAALNERMRILANGQAAYNSTTPVAGDVFSVYGTGYTGATNALGAFTINGYVGANGVGVYGESFSAAANAGIGVFGSLEGASTATGSTSYGILGRNLTSAVGTSVGVGASVTSTSGVARGVNASSASPTGIGVASFNTATTGSAYAVYASSSSAAGIGGIAFVNSTAAGWQGQNAGAGEGLRGFNTNATPATAGSGVYGQTNATRSNGGEFLNLNATGTGLYAVGNNVAGTYLTAGSGAALNGLATGLFANATRATNGTGVTGRSNGSGILSINGGSGVNGVSTLFGVTGFSTSTANVTRAGGYFATNANQSYAYVGGRTAAGVVRKIEGNGTVNTTVKDLNDNLVVLSCPEAPENLFQDYGTGKLVNGRAHIVIDPILAKNIVVSEKHPLKVFIQLEGDCNGVYVTNKSQNGFDVVELSGGTTNTAFSWSIVTNRADEVMSDGSISPYSSERFAPAMGPQKIQVVEGKTKEPSKNEELIKASTHSTLKDFEKTK